MYFRIDQQVKETVSYNPIFYKTKDLWIMSLGLARIKNRFDDTDVEELPAGFIQLVNNIEILDRFDVKPGTIFEQRVLRADVVVFYPGSDLTIGQASDDYVGLVAEKTLVFQDPNMTSSIRVAREQQQHGGDGSDGVNGLATGDDGGNGEDGANGESPLRTPSFVLWAPNIEFSTDLNEGAIPLVIDCNGVDGGSGGNGGRGGAGQTGADGEHGSNKCELAL